MNTEIKDEQRKPRRWLRIVGIVFFALGMILVILVVIFWRAPIRLAHEINWLQIYHAGMRSHYASIDGMEIHYLEGGSGDPVVLVHGLGSRAQQDWVKLFPILLRSGHHVFAMDLPGYGDSAKPADRTYSIAEQARFVESFFDAMHLDHAALGGVSMGGWISAKVAIDQPKYVSRLVLFDAAGMKFKLSFDPAAFAPETRAQVDELALVVTSRPSRIPGFVADDLIRTMRPGNWVIRRAMTSMMTNVDTLEDSFSSIKSPLLIVWGRDDMITPLSAAEEMHRDATQSVLEIYDGCGHVALVACADRVGPNVVGFLAGSGPQPGATLEVPKP